MDALPAVITDHPVAIRELCVKYHVKRLAVFGSAAKGTFDPARSDVDFAPSGRDRRSRLPNRTTSCERRVQSVLLLTTIKR